MSLRKKTVLFTLLAVSVMVVTLYLGAAKVLLGGFANVEANAMREQVRLVEQALENELDTLKMMSRDWSAWTELYEFAGTLDRAFAEEQFSDDMVGVLDLDFVALVNPAGEVAFSKTPGGWVDNRARLPASVRSYLTAGNPLLQHANVRDLRAEIASLPEGPLLVASAPIVTSEYAGPIRGSLIMGRFIGVGKQQELEAATGLSFALDPVAAAATVGRLGQPPQVALSRKTHAPLSQALSDTLMAGHSFVYNWAGKDVFLLEVTAARPIYAQALRSRTALLTVVALVATTFVLLVLVFLQHFILARVATLSRGVQEVARGGSTAQRLTITGRDEFAKLAADTNQMLEALEAAQREADNNEARYALVAQGINDGIWDWDVVTGETYYSPRWRTMLGYAEDEPVSSVDTALAHIHPDDRTRVEQNITAHLKGDTTLLESELRVRASDGTYRWMLLRGIAQRDETSRAVRLAGSLTDLTRRGVFDALTGLPNRLLLQDQLEHVLTQIKEQPDQQSALLFMDLNRFKMVNDSLGHHVGDLLIVEVAKRLQGALRPTDMVARLGGDEFVVVLEGLAGAAELERAVSRLATATSVSFILAGHQVTTSMSIGVVADLGRYSSGDDALRDADNAMYHAKAERVPFVYFDRSMLEQATERLQLETDLRSALENTELSLVYQPVVSLSDAKMRGVEALARWQHPTRGAVQPSEFIPLAEEAGLIGLLGTWVLRESCLHMSRLEGNLSVSVNLSSKQLSDGLVDQVSKILEETGLASHRLVLEVTESAVVTDPVLAAGVLARLRTLGVRIALDDFGTGYSSLSYLSSLPLDILKIDLSFVSRLPQDTQSVAIIKTIITLAQALNLSVVAEGIETDAQADLLKGMGCHFGQGYHFAKPALFEVLPELTKRTFEVSAVDDAEQLRSLN